MTVDTNIIRHKLGCEAGRTDVVCIVVFFGEAVSTDAIVATQKMFSCGASITNIGLRAGCTTTVTVNTSVT